MSRRTLLSSVTGVLLAALRATEAKQAQGRSRCRHVLEPGRR